MPNRDPATRIKTLDDYLLDRFGVRTRAVRNPEITSVGTTALALLRNNPSRLAFTVCNLSVNVMYMSLDRDVSSSKGIPIAASGGIRTFLANEDFQMVGWGWWIVAAGSSSALYVVEVVIS